MNESFWLKQSKDKPLFEDLLWSRPENKGRAGKLLIIGGNAQGFADVGTAYNEAASAGIGTARIILPDVLQRTVSKIFKEAEFTPSTPSGSFSQGSLAELLDSSSWADGVLITGNLGRNSETAILLEKFVDKYKGQLTITRDAADYFLANPLPVLDRPETTLVISFAQLQKMATQAKFIKPFTFDMDMVRLVETLQAFSKDHVASIVTKHLDNIFVTFNGLVSSTKLDEELETWRVKTAAHLSVWWLQNPSKLFESQSSAVLASIT